MNSIETLASFFGWCAVINFGVILAGALFFAVGHDWVGRINAKMFGITNEEAKTTLFQVFQQYRLALMVLNIAPYLALQLML